MPIITTTISTPIGELTAGATATGICLLDFRHRKMMGAITARIGGLLGEDLIEGDHPHLETLRQQLDEYFSGARKDFDLPLQLAGTDFQKKRLAGFAGDSLRGNTLLQNPKYPAEG